MENINSFQHFGFATIFLALLFVCIGSANGTNIYVDQSLSGPTASYNPTAQLGSRHTGGSDRAYATVQEAIHAMNPGDDIYLRGGTYREGHIRVEDSPYGDLISGTPDNWCSIQSYPGEWAILDGENGQGTNPITGRRIGYEPNSDWGVGGTYCVFGFQSQDKRGVGHFGYWLIQRLEIINGATSDGSHAAGFSGAGGPFHLRYVHIHHNQADYGNSNPGGIKGSVWRDSIIEYSYFHDNACPENATFTLNCADVNIMSDYQPNFIAEFGLQAATDNGYKHNMRNQYRYNYFGGPHIGIKYKQDQFFSGRNADGGFPLSDTFKTYGDKVHHNIFKNTSNFAIDAQQDFIQIYNNIFDSCRHAIGIGEGDSRTLYKAVVYNNTIISPIDFGIWRIHLWQTSLNFNQPLNYYGYDYNNILDNVRDGWTWSDIAIDTFQDFNGNSPDYSTYIGDRNYFYRPNTSNNNDPDGTWVYWIDDSRKTVDDYETLYPGTDLYRNDFNAQDLLYQGTSGADRYITRPEHVVEGSTTIADGGIGGVHPYLGGVTIPAYVGATNPNDHGWVAGVLGLADPSYLQNGPAGDPAWIEGGCGNTSAPTAGFSFPATITAGLEFQFIDNSGCSPTSYSWSFGDGTASSERNPAHTYTRAGNYNVTLTVSNTNGSDSTTHTITVNEPDHTPPAPPSGLTAQTVSHSQIDLTWTAPPDPDVAEYTITRTNEANTETFTATATSYSDTGLEPQTEYIYTVTATDTSGNISDPSDTARATTDPLPPVIVIDNADPGFSSTGDWPVSDGSNPYGDNSLYSITVGNEASWTMTIPQTNQYEISAWWSSYDTRHTAVPYSIYVNDSTAALDTVTVNQLQNGGQWNLLGTYDFIAGDRVEVRVTAETTTNSTCADAVQFARMTSPAGDINGDGTVDLTDPILALQVAAGLEPAGITLEGDANGDSCIGIGEAIAAIRKLGGY